MERLPEEHRVVLAWARDDYLGLDTPSWKDIGSRGRSHVDHVISQITSVAAGHRVAAGAREARR
jgi:Domain of unknown function (DUF4111)